VVLETLLIFAGCFGGAFALTDLAFFAGVLGVVDLLEAVFALEVFFPATFLATVFAFFAGADALTGAFFALPDGLALEVGLPFAGDSLGLALVEGFVAFLVDGIYQDFGG